MIPGQPLLDQLADALLDLGQPAADSRLVHLEQMPNLSQRHLVVIVISQQQPLAGFEVRYRLPKRGYHRIAITIAHIIEVRRGSAFRLLSRVSEAIHVLRLFGLNQPA